MTAVHPSSRESRFRTKMHEFGYIVHDNNGNARNLRATLKKNVALTFVLNQGSQYVYLYCKSAGHPDRHFTIDEFERIDPKVIQALHDTVRSAMAAVADQSKILRDLKDQYFNSIGDLLKQISV